ncbi:MAG TPA: type II toxin-antitoxin system PemK/MazF family toxin [Jatrophihabitantaceae bacterium]|nr:type II toxin-antitoxin system PemK/MazF family toxin [Jatrophihabitantaceae bacterium]
MGRRLVNRGDVYLCDFGSPTGHEPGFRRPAVIVSPEQLNRHGTPVVLPVTRSRRGYPTHVELDGPLPITSYVQCELIRAVSADRLLRQVASVDAVHLAQIDLILRRILGL